jgi:hypothetical protein
VRAITNPRSGLDSLRFADRSGEKQCNAGAAQLFPWADGGHGKVPPVPTDHAPEKSGEAQQNKSRDNGGVGLPLDERRPMDMLLQRWQSGIQFSLKEMPHNRYAREMKERGVFVIVSRIITGEFPGRIH